jgi:hypothetical protein
MSMTTELPTLRITSSGRRAGKTTAFGDIALTDPKEHLCLP